VAGSGDLVRAEVYGLLGITSGASTIVTPDTVRRAINRQVAVIAKNIGLGPAWISPAFTTTLVDLDYVFPSGSGVEYEQVLQLVYAADDWPLVKVSMDEITSARAGSTQSHGRQYEYALDVSAAQVVGIHFSRLPNAVEVVKAYVSTMPVPWPAGSAAPPTIPFSTTALRALELLSAEEIGRTLGEDRINALDLNPRAFDSWHVLAVELMGQEELSVIRLKRARGPYNYRWFMDWRGC
jgi:hypothetical protein